MITHEVIIYTNTLLKKLLGIKFINEIYLKELNNYANTTDIKALKELEIDKCLLCNKEWEISKVIPNNSHNFSKSLILKPLSNNNRLTVINKTRPITIIDKKRDLSVEEIKIEDFNEKIENATTFGGICKNCDNIYNEAFEKNKNLNFNNKRHLNLFVERASLFKYYREKRITKIIEDLLKLKNRNIDNNEWNEYISIKKELEKFNIIELRNKIYNKDKILLHSKNKDVIHLVIKKYSIKDIVFTDDLSIIDDDYILINLVILHDESFLILSKKRNNLTDVIDFSEEALNNLKELIENYHFKDIILAKNRLNIDFYGKEFFIFQPDGLYIFMEKNKNKDEMIYILIQKEELIEYGLLYDDPINIKYEKDIGNNLVKIIEAAKTTSLDVNNLIINRNFYNITKKELRSMIHKKSI